MLNMTSVLWDEEVFENAREFNPDRYLEGDITLKKARTIPFGIGKHSVEEIFKCDVCQQTFKNKSTLKRHKVKVLLLYLG